MGASGISARQAHDDPEYFRAAVSYTAAVTSFSAALVEKDYFCTLLLDYLSRAEPALVFKGGTCLTKVHAGFYRLSEDLDFTVPLPVEAGRSARRRCTGTFRETLSGINRELPVFHLAVPLQGANNSSQYTAGIRYRSPGLDRDEYIRLDISLREPLLTPAHAGRARTIIREPATGGPLAPDIPVPCISWLEAMAEKFRAALSRRDVAIRDFYDVDVAVRHWGLDTGSGALVELVRRKMSVPGYERRGTSPERYRQLQAQLAADLRPVLRPRDFATFDLGRAVAAVDDMAASL